jgi:hypothetical protein
VGRTDKRGSSDDRAKGLVTSKMYALRVRTWEAATRLDPPPNASSLPWSESRYPLLLADGAGVHLEERPLPRLFFGHFSRVGSFRIPDSPRSLEAPELPSSDLEKWTVSVHRPTQPRALGHTASPSIHSAQPGQPKFQSVSEPYHAARGREDLHEHCTPGGCVSNEEDGVQETEAHKE